MPNMFDGAQDHHQFHQFVAPIARTTLPLHLSFATPNNNTFLPFVPYNPSHQLPLQTNNIFHPLPHHSPKHDHQEKEEANTPFSSINVEIQRDQRQLPPPLIDSWTNDEVLALLRIRSGMENYFPQLTWEHVSRKLAELGFKKSAEKCKEKFEDESRNFNYGKNNNYRFVSELEGLYQGDDQQNPDPGDHEVVSVTTEKENSRDINKDIDAPVVTKQCDKVVMEKSKDKKRKRRDRFEVFKCFCESVVNKMMAQQEEIHNKLLKDMLKRDEEKLAREEAWKKQEVERMNKELDMMAQEQAIAGDRQAIIIEFLKKYLATSQDLGGANSNNKTKGSNGNLNSQNPNPSKGENNNLEPTPSTNNVILDDHQTTTCTSPPCQNKSALPNIENPSSSDTALLHVPASSNSSPATYNNNNHTNSSLEDIGRRWPRDEVLALINLRCTSLNSEEKEGNNNKAPLWERISQGMSGMGYKRSAKRCKEKWENINKYFRKTKDVKKRSLDSRTCPYFHQLSSLYSQGKLAPQSERLGNHLNETENSGEMSPDQPQAQSSPVGSGG